MSDRPEYQAARLSRCLAEDPRTVELGVKVDVQGDRVHLSGEVASPERKTQLARILAEVGPGLVIDNDVQVSTTRRPPGSGKAVRIAAVGDVHLGEDARGTLRPAFDGLGDMADLLLLAGDLTRHGTLDEAQVVAEEFSGLEVPVVAVLGNHDYHSDMPDRIIDLLTRRGIHVLDGDTATFDLRGRRVGIAGAKGFGGGFLGKCASEFGEREMKNFVRHTIDIADTLHAALKALDAQTRICLTHYAPTPETLCGEPPEIHPFLGAYQLGEAIDDADVDLAIHGHAHFGCEEGMTPGGTRVRNVAQPVIRTAFAVYPVEP